MWPAGRMRAANEFRVARKAFRRDQLSVDEQFLFLLMNNFFRF